MPLSQSELAQYEEADELGVRLEMIAGQPFWEFQPNFQHQDRIGKIYKSVRPNGCVAVLDVGILFPDDSLRPPDLAIFCREPEATELITLIPEAVSDIVTQRSRHKDLVVSPPFCLEMGVKDVLVYDPFTDDVHHFRPDGEARFKPGRTMAPECGCLIYV